jgi:hypothetical protein
MKLAGQEAGRAAGRQWMQVPMISIRLCGFQRQLVLASTRHETNASEAEDHQKPMLMVRGRLRQLE